MKALFVTLMLAGTMGFTAQAQDGRPNGKHQHEQKSPEQRAEMQTKRMAKTLNLTEAQQKTVYAANLKAAQDLQPVMQQMKEARQKAKGIRQQQEEALKQTLTADQFQAFQQQKEERRQHRMDRMKARFMKGDRNGAEPFRPDMNKTAPANK